MCTDMAFVEHIKREVCEFNITRLPSFGFTVRHGYVISSFLEGFPLAYICDLVPDLGLRTPPPDGGWTNLRYQSEYVVRTKGPDCIL